MKTFSLPSLGLTIALSLSISVGFISAGDGNVHDSMYIDEYSAVRGITASLDECDVNCFVGNCDELYPEYAEYVHKLEPAENGNDDPKNHDPLGACKVALGPEDPGCEFHACDGGGGGAHDHDLLALESRLLQLGQSSIQRLVREDPIVSLNLKRRAIQVHSCHGEVVLNVPLTPGQQRALYRVSR